MARMVIFLFAIIFGICTAAPAEELVKTLPNLTEPLRSNHYTGYLPISDVKQLFYWFVESESNPSTDPLVLWLNGGPGCASMEGLFIEMGPFRVRNNGEKVERNPWTWNRIANIIYLDAPAGVGYSYYNTTTPVFTDDQVAQDNLAALKMWFTKFPDKKTNDFYIMGESYGGTYVPMISSLIAKNAADFPNFKGMLIGNGCVDDQINFNTNMLYQYFHGLFDETTFQTVLKTCCKGSLDCDFNAVLGLNNTCSDSVETLSESVYYTGFDPYFLYYACYLNPNLPYPPNEEIQQLVLKNHLRRKMGLNTEKLVRGPVERIAGQPDCATHNDHIPYLNSKEVKQAIRIPSYVPDYQMCNYQISELYQSQYSTMTDFFNTVINANKRIAMFNGDADTLCNVVENSQFIATRLKRAVKHTAHYWTDPVQKPRAVGLWTSYDGIDLVTIKGGGHFPAATEQKPKETYQMFQNFVRNQNYSTPVPFDTPYVPPTTTTIMTTTSISVNYQIFISMIVSFITFLL